MLQLFIEVTFFFYSSNGYFVAYCVFGGFCIFSQGLEWKFSLDVRRHGFEWCLVLTSKFEVCEDECALMCLCWHFWEMEHS